MVSQASTDCYILVNSLCCQVAFANISIAFVWCTPVQVTVHLRQNCHLNMERLSDAAAVNNLLAILTFLNTRMSKKWFDAATFVLSDNKPKVQFADSDNENRLSALTDQVFLLWCLVVYSLLSEGKLDTTVSRWQTIFLGRPSFIGRPLHAIQSTIATSSLLWGRLWFSSSSLQATTLANYRTVCLEGYWLSKKTASSSLA